MTDTYTTLFTDKDWSLICYKKYNNLFALRHSCNTIKFLTNDEHDFVERSLKRPSPCLHCKSSPPESLITLGLLGQE